MASEVKIHHAVADDIKKGRFELMTPTQKPNEFIRHYSGKENSLADGLFFIGVIRWLASKFGVSEFFYVTHRDESEG